MNSENLIPIVVVFAVIVIAGAVVLYSNQRKRRDKLKRKFGPEYDYLVDKEGDERKVEQTLSEREKKVKQLKINPLDESTRERYSQEWREVQSRFVDDPSGSIDHANRLITEVMIARGFPVEDFEQRAADLSVLYPEFVPNYRNAYEIAMRHQKDNVSTEELRQAMVYYHSLFAELLETNQAKEREMELTK
jgi:hypothetical protein